MEHDRGLARTSGGTAAASPTAAAERHERIPRTERVYDYRAARQHRRIGLHSLTARERRQGALVECDAVDVGRARTLPLANEVRRLPATLERLITFLETSPWDWEIRVVDDGSTDNTADIVKSVNIPGTRLLRSGVNHGKGFSVRKGVLSATGDFVLFTDADLSTPIEEVEKLLDVAVKENADVVIGSRGLDMSFIEKHQPTMRESGGRLFNVVVRFVLGLKIYDTQCGFKLFRRATVQSAFEKLTTDRFGFDPELLFILSRQKLKVREVSVRWSHVEGSKVQFLRDGVRMFTDVLRIRWNSFNGKYR